MRVTFRKLIEDRVVTWEAVRGQRTRVPGTAMALGRGGLPHDLVQMIVEGSLGIEDGFWGSVAAGATFKSTGRRRTRPGRAVIASNRKGIARAEGVVGEHFARWRTGAPTPTATRFEEISAVWMGLGDGGELTLDWPRVRVLSVSTSDGTAAGRWTSGRLGSG
jgi:hypothetical protein